MEINIETLAKIWLYSEAKNALKNFNKSMTILLRTIVISF
mgnify:CR=1 FL=1|jgi:hypothetical protein